VVIDGKWGVATEKVSFSYCVFIARRDVLHNANAINRLYLGHRNVLYQQPKQHSSWAKLHSSGTVSSTGRTYKVKLRAIRINCKWFFSSVTVIIPSAFQNAVDLTNYMDWNPSLETDRPSDGQELSRLLWNLKFHYRVHNDPPIQRSCVTFRKTLFFFKLRDCQPPVQPYKLENRPLLAVRDCLFADTLNTWRPHLPSSISRCAMPWYIRIYKGIIMKIVL
jgi:hypothetical protein